MTKNAFIKTGPAAWIIMLLVLFSCLDTDEKSEFNAQLAKDISLIDNYLKDNGITALSDSAKQIRYVIHVVGKGESPTLDSCITTNFAGKLLTTGVTFGAGEKFSFSLNGTVIDGWKVLMPLLHQGDSVTVYIPSGLAYGTTGLPTDNVPPNTNVSFSIKLLTVATRYSGTPSPAGGCQ